MFLNMSNPLEITWMVYLLLLCISFLLFIELSLSSFRFAGIKQYAEMQGLDTLEINGAIAGNLGAGIVTGFATIIIIIPIFLLMQVIWGDWTPEIIRKSIEFNSIYGLVIIAGALFGLLGVIYSFLFGWEAYQKQIRSFRKTEEEEVGIEED